MTLEQRLIALAQAIGTDIKELNNRTGDLNFLETQNTSSLVAAINEVIVMAGNAQEINDGTPAPGVSYLTYSSEKILQLLAALKNELLGGASSAFDTLKELQDALGNNSNAITGLVTAIGNKVDYTQNQSLQEAQKLQACTNIGVGNYDRNFVDDYETARDA